MLEANLGVWAVPPTKRTSSISKASKPAFLITFSTNAVILESTSLAVNSYLNLLILVWKSNPSANDSIEQVEVCTLDNVFLTTMDSAFNLAMDLALFLGLTLVFFQTPLQKTQIKRCPICHHLNRVHVQLQG